MCNLSQGIKETAFNEGYNTFYNIAYNKAIQEVAIILIQTVAKYGASKDDAISDIQEEFNLTEIEATSLVEEHYPQS